MVVFVVSNVLVCRLKTNYFSKSQLLSNLQHLRGAYDCLNSQLSASHLAAFLIFTIFKDAVTSDVIFTHQCGFVYLYMVALASLLIKNQPFELN